MTNTLSIIMSQILHGHTHTTEYWLYIWNSNITGWPVVSLTKSGNPPARPPGGNRMGTLSGKTATVSMPPSTSPTTGSDLEADLVQCPHFTDKAAGSDLLKVTRRFSGTARTQTAGWFAMNDRGSSYHRVICRGRTKVPTTPGSSGYKNNLKSLGLSTEKW